MDRHTRFHQLSTSANTFRPTATLIGQRVIGAKTFGKD